MANRMFQTIMAQSNEAIGRIVGVLDENNTIIACSDMARLDTTLAGVEDHRDAGAELFTSGGFTYKQFTGQRRYDHAVFVEGEDPAAANYAGLLAVSMQGIKQYHDEKFDKNSFVKNVVLNNILPGDLYAKARELHLATDVTRVVLLVRVLSEADISAYDAVQALFPDKQKDFVFNINEHDTVLVKEMRRDTARDDILLLGRSIVNSLSDEHYIKAIVGLGTSVDNAKNLADSFKEAQVALEVGKVFDIERQVISYDDLGIARLIYQLPVTLCEMFLKEVFKQGSIDALDEETLFTIQRFFQNNLNVSETSRGLFVHRNTLVYRLEKIKKLTGLDLREFDDAIVFKVALMVKKYLDSNIEKY
ncbi:helix-turn-helix domain-containing protein [Ruminococcaceae bacterium OttesenSCG-928-N02]|nr:helix-turn-helix domain-containing protein [Ruminococcaceae bacterium OttesenSCG-928-N02]